MSANRPVGLISGNIVRVDPIQHRQPRFRSVSLANRRGKPSSRAKRWGDAVQLFVEQHDRSPLGPPAARSLSMHRLNRALELKPPPAAPTRPFARTCFAPLVQSHLPLPSTP